MAISPLRETRANVLSFDSTSSSESQQLGTASQQTYEEDPGTILLNTEIFCITITNSLKTKSPCRPVITGVATMRTTSNWILLLQYLWISPQCTRNFSVWKRNNNISFAQRWYFKLSKITSPRKILNCIWWNQIIFCLRIIRAETKLETTLSS